MTDATPLANKVPGKDRGKIGKNNKRKGSNGEREIAGLFRSIGYDKAATTRLASRILDNCKVDITYIPVLPQVKVGIQAGMKPENELKFMKEKLEELLPADDPNHNKTKAVIHIKPVGKGKRRSEFDTIVSLTLEDYMTLVSLAYPVKKD